MSTPVPPARVGQGCLAKKRVGQGSGASDLNPVLIKDRVLFCQPFCEIIIFFCGILFFLVGRSFLLCRPDIWAVSCGFAKMVGLVEFSLLGENFRQSDHFSRKSQETAQIPGGIINKSPAPQEKTNIPQNKI